MVVAQAQTRFLVQAWFSEVALLLSELACSSWGSVFRTAVEDVVDVVMVSPPPRSSLSISLDVDASLSPNLPLALVGESWQ